MKPVQFFAAALGLMWLSTAAQALTVSPLLLKMEPATRSVTFTAINDQAYPATIKAKLRRWQQDAKGEDSLEVAEELVIYPLQAVLKPGQKQEFRLFLKSPVSDSRYYRLLIELADASGAAKAGEVRLGQAFSVPMFVESAAARPKLEFRRSPTEIEVRNTGTSAEFIKAVRYSSGERSVFMYLLPGSRKTLKLSPGSHGRDEWPLAVVGRRLGQLAIP